MIARLKAAVRRLPVLNRAAAACGLAWRRAIFPSSSDYWEMRYRGGGTSGPGSTGRLAAFKADFVNRFVVDHDVTSVIEFGCGDGHQVALARYPSYVGLDVSPTAIRICAQRFAADTTKRFKLYDGMLSAAARTELQADLALSLDVVFHLVEDETFDAYMRDLFSCARRFVIVYSSDFDMPAREPHIRHRGFTRWIDDHLEGWSLVGQAPNRYPYEEDSDQGSLADFYVYQRAG